MAGAHLETELDYLTIPNIHLNPQARGKEPSPNPKS